MLTNTSVVWCARDLRGEHRDDLVELLDGHHRTELVRAEHDLDVEGPAVADVDDRARSGPPSRRLAVRARADEEPRHGLDRALGRRTARCGPAGAAGRGDDAVQTLEREREVCAALVPGDGVDLVDDHCVDVVEQLASAPRGREQVERLRRRDDDLGPVAQHRGASGLGRVAVADRDADVGSIGSPSSAAIAAISRERPLEVLPRRRR